MERRLLFRFSALAAVTASLGAAFLVEHCLLVMQRRTLLGLGGAVLAAALIAVALALRAMVRPIRELSTAAIDRAHVELRATQARLLQSGRLASVGQLAAGVAHELNNPLSVVLTYAMLLEDKIQAMPEELRSRLQVFRDQLERIRVGAQRCKAIGDNLLAFSRQSDGERVQISVRELVRRSFDLLSAKLDRSNVTVRLDLPEGLVVFGHLGQLQQVLTNLALNAQQAMGGGGELTVRAAGDGRGGVILEVVDTGPGIAPEHIDRIFDPFFTTKPIGEGTGLGLSIVYGIVTQHHGEISVDSAPGRGATFRIRLPSRAEESSSDEQSEQRGSDGEDPRRRPATHL